MKWLDLTIDGADEFDANLNLIKGGGAALLQEKIVATASDRMIVIADAAKEVAQLGAFPLPVEIIPFGWQTTKALIEETLVGLDVLGRDVTLRMNGDSPLVTDEANFIIDLHLKRIGEPAAACAGAEPDPRRGGERAVHRHLRRGHRSAMATAGWWCATSTRGPRRRTRSSSPTSDNIFLEAED